MIWLTANQNFGRHSAIEQWNRPFTNINEMNQALILAWNQVVEPNHTVWVLGNFAWDPESAEEALKKLNGNIHVIQGKFDQPIVGFLKKNKIYNQGIHHVTQDKTTYTLSYWPQCEWLGDWSFHGWEDYSSYPTNPTLKRVNVSCDLWGFKPVSMLKVTDLFESVKKDQNI